MAVGSSQADRHRRAIGAASRPGNTNRGRLTSAVARARPSPGGGHIGPPPSKPGIGTTAGGHISSQTSQTPGVAQWGMAGASAYSGPGTGLLDGMEPWHAAVLILAGVVAGLVFAPRR